MNEKVISKINKLMALTKSSNKYESEKAAEMAFKLMEENGISSKDLDMANLENDLGAIDKSVTDHKSQMPMWEKQLSSVIAKYFDCVSFINSKWHPYKNWKLYAAGFIGHEANRITAMTMYEWLRKAIQRDACKKFSTYAYQQSYCIGIVQGLMEKYANEKKNNYSGETGLVIYDEVQNWIKNNMNMKESKSRVPSVYSEAFHAGTQASANYSLNKQVGLKRIGC